MTNHSTFDAHRTTKHDFYDWVDIIIKGFTLMVATVVAFQALGEYRKTIKQKLLDQRIVAFHEAILAAGKVQLAKNWDVFNDSLDEFGVVKHGQILATFGEGKAYDAMVEFYNTCALAWNAW